MLHARTLSHLGRAQGVRRRGGWDRVQCCHWRWWVALQFHRRHSETCFSRHHRPRSSGKTSTHVGSCYTWGASAKHAHSYRKLRYFNLNFFMDHEGLGAFDQNIVNFFLTLFQSQLLTGSSYKEDFTPRDKQLLQNYSDLHCCFRTSYLFTMQSNFIEIPQMAGKWVVLEQKCIFHICYVHIPYIFHNVLFIYVWKKRVHSWGPPTTFFCHLRGQILRFEPYFQTIFALFMASPFLHPFFGILASTPSQTALYKFAPMNSFRCGTKLFSLQQCTKDFIRWLQTKKASRALVF